MKSSYTESPCIKKRQGMRKQTRDNDELEKEKEDQRAVCGGGH